MVLLMCRSDYVPLFQNTAVLPFSLRVKVWVLHRTTRISVTSLTSSITVLPFAQVTCSESLPWPAYLKFQHLPHPNRSYLLLCLTFFSLTLMWMWFSLFLVYCLIRSTRMSTPPDQWIIFLLFPFHHYILHTQKPASHIVGVLYILTECMSEWQDITLSWNILQNKPVASLQDKIE